MDNSNKSSSQLIEAIITFIKPIQGLSIYPTVLSDLKNGIILFQVLKQVDSDIFDDKEIFDIETCSKNNQNIYYNLILLKQKLSLYYKEKLGKQFRGDKDLDILAISNNDDQKQLLNLAKYVVFVAAQKTEFIENITNYLSQENQSALMVCFQDEDDITQETQMNYGGSEDQDLLAQIDRYESQVRDLKSLLESVLNQKLNLESNAKQLTHTLREKDKELEECKINQKNTMEDIGMGDNFDIIEGIKIRDKKIEDLGIIIEQLRKEKNREIEQIKQELSAVERQNKELQNLEKNYSKYSEIQDQLVYIKKEKLNLEIDLKKMQREYDEKDNQYSKINDRYKKLADELRQEKEKSVDLKVELSSKSTKLEAYGNSLREKDDIINNLETKLRDLQSQIDIQEGKNDLSSSRTQGHTLEKSYDDIINKLEGELKDVKEQNQKYREKINELEKDDPELLKHEIKILQNKIEDLSIEQSKKEMENELKDQFQNISKELENERAEKRKIQENLVKEKEKNKTLQKQYENYDQLERDSKKLPDLQQKIKKSEEVNGQLKTQVDILEASKQKKEEYYQEKINFLEKQQGKEQNQKIDELTQRLLQKQDEIDLQDKEYKEKINNIRRDMELELMNKDENHQAEIEKLQIQHKEEKKKLEEEHENEIKQLREETYTLQEKITSLENDKVQGQSKIKEQFTQQEKKSHQLFQEREEMLKKKLEEKDQQYKKQISELEQKNTLMLQKEKQSYQQQSQLLEKEFEQKLKSLESQHEQKIQSLKKDFDTQIQVMDQKHKQEIKAALTETEQESAKKSEKISQESQQQLQQYQQELRKLKDESSNQKNDIVYYQNYMLKLKDMINYLQTSKQEEVSLLSGTLQELRLKYQEKNNKLKQLEKQQFKSQHTNTNIQTPVKN